VAECEADASYRCNVYSFHGGLEFYLIKSLEIKDVRLAYAPAMGVGKYGGDIDNWMWPRHTGDFGFYRAYVGKDGKPAE
ncbi:S46 family peptidase, partial [Pseudoalteromonas sp. 45-MNA-CIBAN-0466]